MSILKRILIIFFLLFPISNIFVQNAHANFISSGDTLSTSNYEIRRFDTSAQTTDPRDITFSNDGKKMFTIEQGTKSAFEYILSTPYNISTATFVQSFSLSGETTRPFKIKFNTNGSKMFIVGRTARKVFEYSLSTNFDISSTSVTYTGNFIDVSSQVDANTLFGLAFSPDGKKMFITENGFGLHQYSLNKSFDLSGGANFIRSAEVPTLLNGTQYNGIVFNPSGTRLFMVDSAINAVNQYTLSEGFNIATASFDGGGRDTSAKLSHNKDLNDFKINVDSHYDFFKNDPDYGVYLKISNIN